MDSFDRETPKAGQSETQRLVETMLHPCLADSIGLIPPGSQAYKKRVDLLQTMLAQCSAAEGDNKYKFAWQEDATRLFWERLYVQLLAPDCKSSIAKMYHKNVVSRVFKRPPPFIDGFFRPDFRKGVFDCYGSAWDGDRYIPKFLGTASTGSNALQLLNRTGGFYQEHWDVLFPKGLPEHAILEQHEDPCRGLVLRQTALLSVDLRLFRFWTNVVVVIGKHIVPIDKLIPRHLFSPMIRSASTVESPIARTKRAHDDSDQGEGSCVMFQL